MDQSVEIMQVDVTKCTGCGHCLGVCPVGAISLLKGKAVIHHDVCILCGACKYACPWGAIFEVLEPATAITVPVQPASLQPVVQSVGDKTIEVVPAARSAGRLAWAIPVITLIGREILPRLANSFLDLLERRSSTPARDLQPLPEVTARALGGRGRQAHRRRRGRMV